ncbi:MAG TPA: hypothetical protein VGO11_18090 [Chthoniobacteraceae bacterium]|jgi:hypothetical protein|nr:hypothetical protein [Chthoniobacteraceae bacterium]
MKIIGIAGMTEQDVLHEVERGARFVVFSYTISILVMTFKRPSSIYFVKAHESRVVKGLPFTLLTLFLGWWGIPWGPIYSIGSFIDNFGGGKDLTNDILNAFMQTNAGPPPMPSNMGPPPLPSR